MPGKLNVFTVIRDGISLSDAAMDKAQREGTAPLFIRPTHEEIAAFLATADAKFSGEVGVCFSTAASGCISYVNRVIRCQNG